MFILESYSLSVVFCIVTMLCWGSWANTQKLSSRAWAFPLFYWDYVIGVVFCSLLFGLTLGSGGDEGRPFLEDLSQVSDEAFWSAFLGGIVFNLANLLIVAAIDLAGMAIAFPVGIGLALVLGVIVNYTATPVGDPVLLFSGVALVAVAVILDAMAYQRKAANAEKPSMKGLLFALSGGLLMAFFFRLVAAAIAPDYAHPADGLATPYTAVFIFSIGVFGSNFLWNSIFMKWPVNGSQSISYSAYFRDGNLKTHLTGWLGGIIWCIGISLSMIASEKAGFAISYGLGQGATMVAAAWGVFVWQEFKGAPKSSHRLIQLMFAFFIVGLSLIVMSRVIE